MAQKVLGTITVARVAMGGNFPKGKLEIVSSTKGKKESSKDEYFLQCVHSDEGGVIRKTMIPSGVVSEMAQSRYDCLLDENGKKFTTAPAVGTHFQFDPQRWFEMSDGQLMPSAN